MVQADTADNFRNELDDAHWRSSLAFLVIVTVGAIMLVASGCSHPVRALVGGGMQINGDMGVSGDMGVDGKIDMNGQVVTTSRVDNTASPLRMVRLPSGTFGESSHEAAMVRGTIAIVDVDGLLVDRNLTGFNSMGENPVALFREKIRLIENDPSISAVVLRINSPGGGVTASDVMAKELDRLRDKRNIPIVACLMTTSTGGGYYLASHADEILAHPTSIVGGIGVILNTYNMEDTLGQFNIVSIPIKAGEKIDAGSPERMMEKDERKILQDMANEFHERFIERVKKSRGSFLDPMAETDLFDGRVLTGKQAAACGLVDRVGYLDDAINAAARMAALGDGACDVVLLRRDNDRALTAMDVSPNTPMTSLLSLKLPGLDRSSMPTFLYLWQPEPSIVTASGG